MAVDRNEAVARHEQGAICSNLHRSAALIDRCNCESIASFICNGDNLIVHGYYLHGYVALCL
ncbi:MAG: hypothetical protein ACO3NS_08485, partial [Ilumatobacteraceae bacterium]